MGDVRDHVVAPCVLLGGVAASRTFVAVATYMVCLLGVMAAVHVGRRIRRARDARRRIVLAVARLAVTVSGVVTVSAWAATHEPTAGPVVAFAMVHAAVGAVLVRPSYALLGLAWLGFAATPVPAILAVSGMLVGALAMPSSAAAVRRVTARPAPSPARA